MEVKSSEGTVVVADRNNCCNDKCDGNHGWGFGWGVVGGALVGGGFGAAAVSVWDKINDTKADIQKVESSVQEAKAGIYKDISDAARGVTGVSRQVEGVGKEILNNRFATERGLCDLGYKTNADIRDSRDQMGAEFNRVMDRLCQMEHQQSTCCCEIKGLVRESENRLALQAERNHCEVMKGQQEIKCLIENTAKDQEIARLNRVVDAQRDQNIINSVVQALGNKTA
ncbi:MAG: hypothetical protein [Bacteriophage sp.]|nr:MAG: hypothetical protein [Bacteriophage sp.]